MNWEFALGQALACVAGLFVIALLRWRYRSTITRTARRQSYQYRIFSLRDEAIRLVIDGAIREDDPHWKRLYGTLNDCAGTVVMSLFMKSWFGPFFTLFLLRHLPKPADNPESIQGAPNVVRQVWEKFALTVVSLVWDGSIVFRTTVHVLSRWQSVKRLISRYWPDLLSTYEDWNGLSRTGSGRSVIA